MSPVDLLDLCMASVARWNAEGATGPAPTVLLVVPKKRCPTGETVALFGRWGPRGRIATIRETDAGYDVVAYFPAIAVVQEMQRAFEETDQA